MVGIRKGMFAMRALVIIFFAVLMLAGTAMGEIPRNGLVGEWHFDGDAKDSSGNGNDGKIYGATFVDGKFGKALSFNGVDNYVNAGSLSQITNDSDWSVSFWMNSASIFLVASPAISESIDACLSITMSRSSGRCTVWNDYFVGR
jgi:hypothetical protein